MNWQKAEILGYAYYADSGYRILVSLISGHGYDFVAEKDGKFIRVNVKVAGLKSKNQLNSWCISQSSGVSTGHKDTDKVDVYLVWFPPQERFLELPGDFLNGGNSKSKLITKNFYQRAKAA